MWNSGKYQVFDAPVKKINNRTEFIIPKMVELVRYCDPGLETLCVFERVSSRPGEGSVSSFRFGQGVGIWQGILATYGIPVVFVSPQVWKRSLQLGKDKEKSLELARKVFPLASLKRKKDHGRAEALLLMHWYMTNKERVTK